MLPLPGCALLPKRTMYTKTIHNSESLGNNAYYQTQQGGHGLFDSTGPTYDKQGHYTGLKFGKIYSEKSVPCWQFMTFENMHPHFINPISMSDHRFSENCELKKISWYKVFVNSSYRSNRHGTSLMIFIFRKRVFDQCSIPKLKKDDHHPFDGSKSTSDCWHDKLTAQL